MNHPTGHRVPRASQSPHHRFASRTEVSPLTRRLRAAIVLLPLLLIGACHRPDQSSSTASSVPETAKETSSRFSEEMLTFAVDNLNRLEEFSLDEIPQQLAKRLNDQMQPQAASNQKSNPLLATWPEPPILQQIRTRLNQWLRTQTLPPRWQADPLLATLPAPLAELPMVRDLAQLEFSLYDGFALREAVWMRDVADWARGEQLGDVERAKRLFDWTVRNIQLESSAAPTGADIPGLTPLVPWEVLMFGQGRAIDRAWVFVLLARQQHMDAALLALADPEAPDKPPRPWAVALLSGGQLYLFDPTLGLPIPAPDGIRLDKQRQLDIQPATLAQVMADEKLLRQLDLDPAQPYPVKAADLKHVLVLLEASPACLTARVQLLQSRLAARQAIVLTADPTAQAKRFQTAAPNAKTRLWLLPYTTLHQRLNLNRQQVQQRLVALMPFFSDPTGSLMKGRMLYLKGTLTGPQGAAQSLQNARPPDEGLADPRLRDVQRLVYQRAKQDATYWLGLIAFERANYPSAIDYFSLRTLETSRGGPWTHAAHYNLARTYEASAQPDRAILRYQSDVESPAYHGNALRAKWLRALFPEAAPPETAPAKPQTAPTDTTPAKPEELKEPELTVPQSEPQPPDPKDDPTSKPKP